MPKALESWTVLPHGQLIQLEENLLFVTGTLKMPFAELPRCMTIARLPDERLVIYSAVALDEDEMRRVEAFGTPSFLVVPGGLHRMDAKIWKARYPRLQVVAASGVRARVEEVVAVDRTERDVDFGHDSVELVAVEGTNQGEAALLVRSEAGTTLVVNDIIGNIQNAHGIGGVVLGVAGFAGAAPQIPRVIALTLVRDARALHRQLLAWSELPHLRRVIVAHGSPIDTRPSAALKALADGLPPVPSTATGAHA
jgi:hypothetical protein